MTKNDPVLRHPLLLAAILTLTLGISIVCNRWGSQNTSTVTIPTLSTAANVSALDAYRSERAHQYATDLAALQKLCDTETLESALRSDAARRITHMVAYREQQLALEGALTDSPLSPCIAVVTEGSVTVVTSKETITDTDAALVISLAQVHAGVKPDGVRIITAQ